MNFEPFPILSTTRLVLRKPEITDDKEIFALRSDKTISQYIDRPIETTIKQTQAFIEKINEGITQNKSLYWVICLAGSPARLIGAICLWNFSDNACLAEIGYELSPEFQGKGLMNEALKAVIDYSFNRLKVQTLEAYTHKENTRSTRLLEKNGFVADLSKDDKENPDNRTYILSSAALQG